MKQIQPHQANFFSFYQELAFLSLSFVFKLSKLSFFGLNSCTQNVKKINTKIGKCATPSIDVKNYN